MRKKHDNIRLYHVDHLGSTSLVTDIDGEVTQHVAYIPYGEVFVEQRNGSWNTPYLFNAKELDVETGLYYYGARYLDPAGTRWLSVDPVFHPGSSPYAYCMNNPIKMVDPDGRDTIMVSEKGFVSNVKESEGDNVFMDYNGKTLTFNDKEIADKEKSNQKYEVGDRVYMNMSYSDALAAIKKVPQNEDIIEGGLLRYLKIYLASHGDADFTFGFLDVYYDKNHNPGFEAPINQCGNGAFRARYAEDLMYFRFEGTNILYNIYDSGNFMWGAWSKHVGITDSESQWGPGLNELFQDSDADSRAIRNGRMWYNKNIISQSVQALYPAVVGCGIGCGMIKK